MANEHTTKSISLMGHVPAILNFSNCNVHMQLRFTANVNFGQEGKLLFSLPCKQPIPLAVSI